MQKEIKIPEIAENVDSGIVGGILVSKGDKVEKDQSLLEVETDKAATDIPSPFEGSVAEIRVNEGDEVNVNQVVMILDVSDDGDQDEDEDDENEREQETKNEGSEKDEQTKRSGSAKETIEEKESDNDTSEDSEEESNEVNDESSKNKHTEKESEKSATEKDAEDIPASPAVRRMAREAGIDLSQIKSERPGGRITAEDIKQEKDKSKEKSSEKSDDRDDEIPDFSEWGETHTEQMNTIRRITARNMTQSWQQIPQVTQFDEADITEIEAYRNEQKEAFEKKGGKLTITAMLTKVVAFALLRFPRFNASIDDKNNQLIFKHYTHIGIAVDTEKGLIVPVIKDADKKSLADISRETTELAKKARESKISPDELKGGNFTISNLGGLGGTGFTPIVYSPQVAILGMSRASYKPVYKGEKLEKKLILPLTLTYDHRVIDGADGARFLNWLCEALENPFAILK